MNKRPTLKFHIQQTICSDEGQKNAGNVSFSIPVRWSIYIVNSVDEPNFRVSQTRSDLLDDT